MFRDLETSPNAGDDRRRTPRRTLPFGRSALLEVDGRDHVASLVDISRGGAHIATRAEIPAGASLCLKLWLPSSGGELRLPIELLRVMPQSAGRLAGIAVRFAELAAEAAQRLETFVADRRLSHPPSPARQRM